MPTTMPPKKSLEPSEGDIVATKAAVTLANLQRRVASWLPPKTTENTQEDDEEDENNFEVGYE